MYQIYLTNFGFWCDEKFDTLYDAVRYGRSNGYEFSVHKGEKIKDIRTSRLVGYCSGVSLTYHVVDKDEFVI